MRWGILLAAMTLCAQTAPPTPREIILRSTGRDARDLELSRNYTYVVRSERSDFDSAGNVKSSESETQDVTILYGQPYFRTIERSGQPLSAGEERKEQEKMDKEIAKRKKETQKDRDSQKARDDQRLAEQKDMLREVADAFTFQLVGEEDVDGHRCWVLAAEPVPGYKPKSRRLKSMPKLRGKLWVTQEEYRWVRLDAEVIDTFSVGLFLLRVQPGTRLEFEQKRVQDEIWLPSRARLRGHARLALLKKYDTEIKVSWENYRKFQTDTRVLPGDTTSVP